MVVGEGPTRFPVIIAGHPVSNPIFGIFSYLSVAAVVPIGLLLLTRTGQPPETLGLGAPSLKLDIWPGLGLAAASFAAEIPVAVALSPVLAHDSALVNRISIGHVPGYYVIWGIAISAIAEEVLVNGYLLTRLGQLGWTPRSALILTPGAPYQLPRVLRTGLLVDHPLRIFRDTIVPEASPTEPVHRRPLSFRCRAVDHRDTRLRFSNQRCGRRSSRGTRARGGPVDWLADRRPT